MQTDYEEDWLGAPMYWSGFDPQTNRQIIEEAGLNIISAREETEEEHGQPARFFWVVAQKPRSQSAGRFVVARHYELLGSSHTD